MIVGGGAIYEGIVSPFLTYLNWNSCHPILKVSHFATCNIWSVHKESESRSGKIFLFYIGLIQFFFFILVLIFFKNVFISLVQKNTERSNIGTFTDVCCFGSVQLRTLDGDNEIKDGFF